jgi:prolyl 4-hydroxylase
MTLFRQLLATTLLALRAGASDDNGADYGVDCSFPVHSTDFSCGDLLGDRRKLYDEFMDGCRAKWGEKGAARCDAEEEERFAVNQRQPQSTVVRYKSWFL